VKKMINNENQPGGIVIPAGALTEATNELESEKNDLMRRLQRSQADLDNYRKRARRDLEETKTQAAESFIRSLLPVLDNFERAMEAGENAANPHAVVEGVKLVYQQFLDILKARGIEQIEAKDQPFDPSIHEAVQQQPTDEFQPGTCIIELARGYRMNDHLLRPARVVVSVAPKEEEGQGENELND